MNTQVRVGMCIVLLLVTGTIPRDRAEPLLGDEVENPIFPKTGVTPRGSSTRATHENGVITHYQMQVVVDTRKTHWLACTYSVEYVNREKVPLAELFFHVYPNAWQDEGGALIINSVTDHDGTPFTTDLVEATNLCVALDTPLQPGQALEIRMTFDVQIPNIPNRFGYWHSENMTAHSLGNWYPIAAVFDETGWHTAPYAYWGESFYSDIANYQVNITVPTGEVVAATGSLRTTVPHTDGTTTWVWEAEAVRDFVFAVSPDFHVSDKTAPGTTIYSYYGPEDEIKGERALEIAENCLRVFPTLYGAYPYPTLSIVENPDGAGGMEYPTLVLMGAGLYRYVSDRTFEAIIVHEIAHQWFPFLIGDNAFAEPFLDEAFATFSEHLYWEFVHGPEAGELAWQNTRADYFSFLGKTGGVDEPINQTMAFWDKNPDYFPVVYSKGALVLRMLRFVMGNVTFFQAMQGYYDQFLHQNAKIQDFITVCEETSAADLEWFFDQWVFNAGLPQYELEHAEVHQVENGYELTLHVQQQPRYGDSPGFRMPVPFQLQYAQHLEMRTAWVNTTRQEIRFTLEDPPRGVELDPHRIILRANIDQPLTMSVSGPSRIFDWLTAHPGLLTGIVLLGVGSLVLVRKWRRSRPHT